MFSAGGVLTNGFPLFVVGAPAFGVEMIAVFTFAHFPIDWFWLLGGDSALASWAAHVLNVSPAPSEHRSPWVATRLRYRVVREVFAPSYTILRSASDERAWYFMTSGSRSVAGRGA